MEEDINILIVDDNQENLKVVSNFLKDKGYNIALSLDGPGALKILETDKIDLILLDIMMPGMNGFEVCEKIRSNENTIDIPIIFLTAKNDTDDVVKGFQIGGVDYITKPFKKEELYARVSTHVQLKRIRDWFRNEAERNLNSKYAFMRNLLDMGKIIDPNE
ncbi:MAG: response regulator [Salinivirgaceae bacterium]|nr:response regulator [Salinivirgaceae bacterium]